MGRQSVHRGIRGSAALATERVSLSAVPAEALEPGEMRRLPFAGELLGAARVRSSFVAVPLDAFDETAPGLSPEEQAAYLQLIRLSYGEGRNWCRVPKRALEERLHASERRLLRMLDGLVAKGLARPLHRDNRGTLWRVFLPREATGQPVGDEVLLGRPQRSNGEVPARVPVRCAPPAASAPPRTRALSTDDPLTHALADARGEADEAGLARAARELAELRAEGQSTARIEAAIEALRARRNAGPASASFTGRTTHGSMP